VEGAHDTQQVDRGTVSHEFVAHLAAHFEPYCMPVEEEGGVAAGLADQVVAVAVDTGDCFPYR
jgi:hypothetical protein